MQNAYFDITNNDIANLPAGPVGFAAGYQRVGNSASFQPDSVVVKPLSGATPILPTSGSTSNEAAYFEFDVPLIANAPFAKLVDVDIATRHTRNSTLAVTNSNNSSRVGLKWQPTEDLLIRGSWSQGFRTADISELFAGLSSNSPIVYDPCSGYLTSGLPQSAQQRCAAAGVPPSYVQANDTVPNFVSGNPDLKPERSISKTLGFVYSPSWLPGFNAQIDYYHIKLTNTIQAENAITILDGCYLQGDSNDCSKIIRFSNGTGDLKQINNPITNIGGTITSGADLGVAYSFPSMSIGQFEIGLEGTYINEYEQLLPNPTGEGFNVDDLLGVERGGAVFPLGVPRWKANANVTWMRGPWRAEWKIQYIGSLRERCSDYLDGTAKSLANMGLCSSPNFVNNALSTNYIGKTAYNDAQIGYSFDQLNTTLTFGVNNVFNRNPPESVNQEYNSFDPTLYRIPGRFYYASIGVKF